MALYYISHEYQHVTVPGKSAHVAHFFQTRVIDTVAKNRLLATKCATYLVTKVNRCGVIAVASTLSCQPQNAKVRENVD